MKGKLWTRYLVRARTISEETVGDGAMTISGSPSSESSHSICRWIRTDWKHLRGEEETEADLHLDLTVTEDMGSSDLKKSSSWTDGRSVGTGMRFYERERWSRTQPADQEQAAGKF